MLKMFRKILIVITLVALVVASIISYQFYQMTRHKNPADVVIKIKKGSSVKKIARQLADANVVANRWVFEIYLRATGQSARLKAGEYEFEEGLTLTGVIDKMVAGRVKRYRLTIPEGYNLNEICALLVDKKLMTSDVCRKQAMRVGLLKEPEGVTNLEGYLFPDTYFYDSDYTPAGLIEQMVALFYKKLGDERVRKAKEMGLSVHELVTLASLVEKETAVENERPLIAAVFLNRLKKGMLLQTDPSVIYGIQHFDGNLTRKQLETDTPYNTYTRPGLPPGPIASPGLDAIDAVLNPAQTDYLYFVAKGDGSHYFSKTIGEHNQAVRRFQLNAGGQP